MQMIRAFRNDNFLSLIKQIENLVAKFLSIAMILVILFINKANARNGRTWLNHALAVGYKVFCLFYFCHLDRREIS